MILRPLAPARRRLAACAVLSALVLGPLAGCGSDGVDEDPSGDQNLVTDAPVPGQPTPR